MQLRPARLGRQLEQASAAFRQNCADKRTCVESRKGIGEEIERLAAQVSTVNMIYRDIASLVGAQQEDVDEIEDLVSRSHDRTTSGHRQLERAVRRRVQKHRCCAYFLCFLLLLIVLIVLAVIVARHVPAAAR